MRKIKNKFKINRLILYIFIQTHFIVVAICGANELAIFVWAPQGKPAMD